MDKLRDNLKIIIGVAVAITIVIVLFVVLGRDKDVSAVTNAEIKTGREYLASLEAGKVSDVENILKEQRNAILKQYQKLLAMDEVKLTFDDSSLHAIAAKAMERNTGARALRAILEQYMLDIMFEIPKDENIGEVVITREYIEGTGGPRIVLRGQQMALPG